MSASLPRIVYLQPSLVPPSKNPAHDRHILLSDVLEGDIIQAIWYGSPADAVYGQQIESLVKD